jgi:hypothetical protein
VSYLSEKGKEVKGKKGVKVRAKFHAICLWNCRSIWYGVHEPIGRKIKLKVVSLKSSYVAALQIRKSLDVPTTSASYIYFLLFDGHN